jgi:hypothetical protein
MVADPAATPFTSGTTFDFVAPWGIMMAVGVTVTFEVSLLARVMNRLPVGAAADNVTGKATD